MISDDYRGNAAHGNAYLFLLFLVKSRHLISPNITLKSVKEEGESYHDAQVHKMNQLSIVLYWFFSACQSFSEFVMIFHYRSRHYQVL